jgi:glyoxylase-like metal-dependent hydrolase (beta-lactamase superfamily II)
VLAELIAGTGAYFPPRLHRLGPGVYAAVGDTGKGSEGQPNAGFVVTSDGVVVIDALASPKQGRELLQAIRSITTQPIKWLVLTHHHPDHHFGAVVFRREGAQVIAHPDRTSLALEAGEDALLADWVRVVGLDAMRGFEFADTPDRAVTTADTLSLGNRTLVISHPGTAHSPGDLMVWLPAERVLFAGDLLVEDGVTMVVDGSSSELLEVLGRIDSLHPRYIVPGHGALPPRAADLTARTRTYITRLKDEMRGAVERGIPMGRALRQLPPADQSRPVSYNSRRRRNALRVYLEEERAYMGLDSSP